MHGLSPDSGNAAAKRMMKSGRLIWDHSRDYDRTLLHRWLGIVQCLTIAGVTFGDVPARLGNVLFWASILIAGGWVWLNYEYEQQNSAITWGGAVLAWLVGRACQYVLGGDNHDDDKKQLEVKGKQLEAKSEKDTNTISTESVSLKEEDVAKAQLEFEEGLEGDRDPADVSGREIYVYRNLMSKWFNDLNAEHRYEWSMSKKIRTDWYDYMRLLESEADASRCASVSKYSAYLAKNKEGASEDRIALEARAWSEDQKAQEARKRFMAIEDGFAAAIGEEAIKQLQEVRSRDDDAFDDSGTMAPIGYYYEWDDGEQKLAPIGYHYDDGELVSDDGQLEWRQANAYERLQKLRDFVERSGGVVYDTKWPSKVSFFLPYAILKELFEANAKLFVALDEANGAITDQTGVPGYPGAVCHPATGEPIKIPSSAASTCQIAMIDLVSISDDELELITRHPTSAS
jgi:hypothetical protein